MSRLLTALKSGRILLMDGAIGTELQRAGRTPADCGEQWNLTHADKIRAIHESYIAAGAECILTNTFQANPTALTRHGLEQRLGEIYHEAITIARSATTEGQMVLANVGPIPRSSADWLKDVAVVTQEADALLLETLSGWMGPEMLTPLRTTSNLPIFVSFAYKRTVAGRLVTEDGMEPKVLASWANDNQIDGLGVNCGLEIGMDEVIEIITCYRRHTSIPLFARPNAGTPRREGDRWHYPHTPEEMARRLPELLEAGVCMVGGCCGTTPAYIAAFRAIIEQWNASLRK